MKRQKKINSKLWGRIITLSIPLVKFINSIAPSLLRSLANKGLNSLKGYTSHIGKISITRSSIKLGSFYLAKKDEQTRLQLLFVDALSLEIIFDRTELWTGNIVCDIDIDSPAVGIVKNIGQASITAANPSPHISPIPFLINRFSSRNCKIEYTNPSFNPALKVHCEKLNIIGTKLSNQANLEKELSGEITVRGDAYGGHFCLNLKGDFAAREPLFDMTADLTSVNMVSLNDLFQSYAGFKVENGKLNMYAEAATANSRFKGYVKPIIEDIKIDHNSENHKSAMHILLDDALSATAAVLENKNKDIATKIPFTGTLTNVHINVWYAVIEILKNAFVSGLQPTLDHDINIDDVKKTA